MARLNDVLAQGLCDVHHELIDIKHVISVCEQLLHRKRQPERARNKRTEWALWESAVISYARTFGTGRGARGKSRWSAPKELVDHLSPQLQTVHRSVMKERDQHVAHRVNNREIGEVFALLASSGPQRLLDIQVMAFRPSAPGRSRAKGLLELATTLHGMLQQIMTEMREEAATLVASRLEDAYAHAQPAEINMRGEIDEAWSPYLPEE